MMHLKQTELCLGLPGGGGGTINEPEPLIKITGKRGFSETIDLKLNLLQPNDQSSSSSSTDLNEKLSKDTTTTTTSDVKPPAKAQVVGWPPVRNYRKNVIGRKSKTEEAAAFVKVSMDGAPYLRKVDLKMYNSYQQLSDALANMFSSFTTTTGCHPTNLRRSRPSPIKVTAMW